MSTETNPPPRVTILFDGNNWFYAYRGYLKRNGLEPKDWRLDLQMLGRAIVDQVCGALGWQHGTIAPKIVYFTAVPAEDVSFRDALVRLLDHLEHEGITVSRLPTRTFEVTCAYCEKKQLRVEEEQVDVALATELLTIAAGHESDVVVIVTGDSDFVPAVRAAQDRYGTPVFVASVSAHDVSRELAYIARDCLELDPVMRSCLRERAPSDPDDDKLAGDPFGGSPSDESA